jgi:uncharacterized membrane protein
VKERDTDLGRGTCAWAVTARGWDVYEDYFEQLGVRKRPVRRDARTRQIHAIFGALGLVAGLIGAFVAYDRTSSIALPIFVFYVVLNFVARGLGDVVTDAQKVRRLLYFGIPVVVMSGTLYLTYRWWGLMWLAALLGVFVGGLLSGLLTTLLFPRIAEEERIDTGERLREELHR